jgi:hypothetical protein
MESKIDYSDGWYSVRMPANELLLFTNMFIEGLEQFSDGLLVEQVGVDRRAAQDFMTNFTEAMADARERSEFTG